MSQAPVAIDYTSRDFSSLRTSLLQYAAVAYPDWTPSSEGDFGVVLLELMAYVGDILSYYTDRAQFEAYLPTATQLSSVLNIAQLLGYQPGTGQPATGTVNLIASVGSGAINVAQGTQFQTDYIDAANGPIIFEAQAPSDSSQYWVVPANPDGSGSDLVVNIVEGQTIKNVDGSNVYLATSNGLPSQVYQFPDLRIYGDTIQIWVNDILWTSVDDLLLAGPNDQVYSTSQDDQGYTYVTFGDNTSGAIPPNGFVITYTYRVGWGSLGNLPAGSITTVTSSIPGLSIENSADVQGETISSATTGGADPEGIEQIRTNAPKVFNTQSRAITAQDYADLALNVPGVVAANAVIGNYTTATLYILGPDGGLPNSSLIDATQKYMSNKTLAGVSLTVSSPTLVSLDVGTTGTGAVIQVLPTYSQSQVQTSVSAALSNFFSPANSSFGELVTVADLYAVAMAVPGVQYITIPSINKTDGSATGISQLQLLPYEFPTVGNIYLTANGGIS